MRAGAHSNRILLAGGVSLLMLASQATPVAQPPAARRPMSIVDLAQLPRVLDPQLSPDGRSLLYMLTRADWRANRPLPHIWKQPVGGGTPSQVTSGDFGEQLARWSPDGSSWLFLTRRTETATQIYVMPAAGGEARAITQHATSVSQPAWSPDGLSIYFTASDPPTAAERERDRLRDDLFEFEQNLKPRHLWRVTVAGGAEQKLTSGNFSVESFKPSGDGRHVLIHRTPTTLPDDDVKSEIWILDADGGNPRAITNNAVEELEGEISPDNSRVLFIAEASERLEPYYPSTLFIVPFSGGAPDRVLRDFPYAIEHAAWTPDGAILAVVNMGVHSEIFRIDAGTRRARALTDGDHSVQFWSLVGAAGRSVFQLDEPSRLGDVWTQPLDGGTPTRVTGHYDSFASDFDTPRQEKVVWKGADQTPIEGILFYPSGYRAGTRYPLVVQLHGGPGESDKFGYGPGVIVNYLPVLTARGYAVLRPNYRGSSGYGAAFLRDVVGNYFRNMHLDVMAGVDALIARGIVDPDKLAVMGWSAGGHLTNKLITFTPRFKAASASAGLANWTSFYSQTDWRANRAVWFGGTPWQSNAPIELFWAQSPLRDAAKVKTPTLFFVGQDDPRVPMPQSVEMYRALAAAGVETRLYVAPREGHQWGELRHQVAKANLEMDWFERHVTGRRYTFEQAPGDTPATAPLANPR
jgi:dipeptidyl aminopeptidase/acylaminoacyl peptidase